MEKSKLKAKQGKELNLQLKFRLKQILLAKKVKETVDDKAKYTDFLNKSDIRANLQSDIIRLLSKNGYPPKTFGDIYAQIIEQVENFKKNNMQRENERPIIYSIEQI